MFLVQECFHALAIDKMHIYGINMLGAILMTSSLCSETKTIWATCLF